MHIGVIVGSLSAFSINRELARAVSLLLADRAVVTDIDVGMLPLYNRDLDENPPPVVREFKARVRAVDALLLITPEYNRTTSSALKNAFEWGSRPHGQSVFGGVPAAVLGASTGALGTALAQQHVRNVLAALDMPALGHPEAFVQYNPDHFADGEVVAPATRDFLLAWADRFVDHVALHLRPNAVLSTCSAELGHLPLPVPRVASP